MLVTQLWGITEQTAAFIRMSGDPVVCGRLNPTSARAVYLFALALCASRFIGQPKQGLTQAALSYMTCLS
jgi:hypothetical protein